MDTKNLILPIDSDLDTVAKRLKYVIEQSGIKQSHIAKKMGVSRGAVHYVLNSEAKKSRSAQRIGEMLGIDGEWLATGKKSNFNKTEQKYSKTVSARSIPFYYLDQLLLLQQESELSLTPVGHVLVQREYQQQIFAVQLSTASPLQKFEAGEIIVFTETDAVKAGDWVLVYCGAEARIIFGIILLQQNNETVMLHHKIDNPLMLDSNTDRVLGVFVEAIKYAKA